MWFSIDGQEQERHIEPIENKNIKQACEFCMKNILSTAKVLSSVILLLGVVYVSGNVYLGGFSSDNKAESIAVIDPEDALEAAAPEEPFDLATFVADALKGKKVAGKCKACHQFKNNGKNGVGPNLWNVYNRQIAAIDNFKYSDAFKAKVGEISWDKDHLYGYLADPKGYIPGNKMAFAGIKKEADRLNLIAYLETLK